MPSPFPHLVHPIVQAPLSGGPSTPELTAAVNGSGGLGFLAAGYKTPDSVLADITRTRGLTSAPFGVNLFCTSEPPLDQDALLRYTQRLEDEARRYGIELGQPRYDDDWFDDKVEVALAERVAIVSFTFGCPPADVVARLHHNGLAVWVTVTEVDEAVAARDVGADALVVQGIEAGGHRGSFVDLDGRGEIALLPLLRLATRAVELPLIAAGGIGDGRAVAAVLAAGAVAAQIGTAFMRCPEAGTSPPHRDALARPGRTAITRAFTGRRARGIVNRFMVEHADAAPSAYPHVHHLTSPLRAAARQQGDADTINLWAGEAYPHAEELSAAELVRRWGVDAHMQGQSSSMRSDSGA